MKSLRIHIIFYAFLASTLFLIGCEKADDGNTKKRLFDSALKQRISEYETQRINDCLSEVQQDAEHFIDSLLVQEIGLYAVDDDVMPEKPIRPQYEKRDSQRLADQAVKPLWDTIPDPKD